MPVCGAAGGLDVTIASCSGGGNGMGTSTVHISSDISMATVRRCRSYLWETGQVHRRRVGHGHRGLGVLICAVPSHPHLTPRDHPHISRGHPHVRHPRERHHRIHLVHHPWIHVKRWGHHSGVHVHTSCHVRRTFVRGPGERALYENAVRTGDLDFVGRRGMVSLIFRVQKS